jgi:hypothetical protein
MQRALAPVVTVALATLLCPALASRAHAVFHLMRISEVMTQAAGDPRIQFVELTMTDPGQNLVGGHDLFFYDAHGNLTGSFELPADVASGADGATILLGTQAFADASSAPPDFILPDGLLAPFAGRVTFEGEGEPIVDSVAYGAFDGPNTGYGDPAAGFPVLGTQSLTLATVTPPGPPKDNSADYAFAAPTPRRNNGTNVTLTIPPVTCYVTDDFADMSKWDRPEPNAGLDFTACGGPTGLDIGFVDAVMNKLIFIPGETDLGLGAPIAMTGLKNSVAEMIGNPNHRATFHMMALPGITNGAAFVRQRYFFDDATSLIDAGEAAGLGMNFSFDDAGEISDHLHADVRVACIQEGEVDGEDEGQYPGYTLKSNTPYTVVMDVDGDDESGPLTLQVKLYPSAEPEPIGYLGTFTVGLGLGPLSDESLSHGFLFAALGSSQGEIQLTDFSICEIPRNQKYVKELTCLRNEDGTVSVAWSNPFDAEDRDIAIRVNGAKVDDVSGNATNYTIVDPPAGALVVAVVNYSGTPVECTVCENNPPVPAIDGPAQVTLVAGTAMVTLDSSASTDGDDGTQGLIRLWEIVSAPPGGTASLDDQGAVAVNMNVNAPGEYRVRLTLVDVGCTGSVGLTEIAEHTFTARDAPAGGFHRGDSNNDAKHNISDPVTTLNALFLGIGSIPCEDAADSNDDGMVNISDPVNSLNVLFLGIGTVPPPLPPEAGEPCGQDPTPEEPDLGCATYDC